MHNASRDESSALDVRLIEWNLLPFQSHPDIINIWGPRDAAALKALIQEDGGIREPLRCARVKGLDGPPVLYDGYTRLVIHFARKSEGKPDTVPAYIVEEFDDLGQVLQKVLKVQAARRNVTAPQMAHMALQIKAMQGFDISPKPNGRPTNESRNGSLKPLPSAKALSKQFGVSDRIIRIVQQASALPDKNILDGMLARPDSESYLSPTQVDQKIEAHRRTVHKKNRDDALQERGKAIQKMAVEENPELVAPDGLFTIDAIEGMRRIAAGTVDLVCTSIPYPCSVRYDNSIPYDGDYPKFLDTYVRQFFAAAKPALKMGGRIAINFDNTYRMLDKQNAGDDRHRVANLFNVWKDISVIAEDELGYLFMGYRIWYKQTCARRLSTGSRDSRSPVGNPNTEFVLIFGNESVQLDGESDISQKEYDVFALSHWYILPQRRVATTDADYHPAPFPDELPYRLIKMLCPTNGTVLDPFSGSGTTAFVAKALGRKFIGLDNSPLSTASAARRLAKLDGLTAGERLTKIERFILSSEHGMPKHKRVRGVESSDDGGDLEGGSTVAV